jgi:hypothetical protein
MIRDKVSSLKTGLKDKGKAKVGILIHKKIGELFEFDEQAVNLTDRVIGFYEEGELEKAAYKSKILEHYIKARMNKETRYRQKAQEVTDKLEAHADKLEDIKENLDDSRFSDLLEGAVDPETVSEDVDQELLDQIYEEGVKN